MTITPLGNELVDLSRPVVERVEAAWLARLGERDSATLRRLLAELVELSED